MKPKRLAPGQFDVDLIDLLLVVGIVCLTAFVMIKFAPLVSAWWPVFAKSCRKLFWISRWPWWIWFLMCLGVVIALTWGHSKQKR